MSRCFPFPPPGYERKTKADDTDLLKKEKQRDKKHKKEKKDKEKKEGKEKREKERSEEKHKEKKDKKEKHRDKKKDKEKNRDKDKHKNDILLSDTKVVGSADNHVHKPSVVNHVHEPSAHKHVHKPSADNHVHKPSADNHVHNSSEKIKERENDRSANSAWKRTSNLPAVHNGMPVTKSNHQISETKNLNAPEFGRKSMAEERRTANQLPDKNVNAEKKKDGGVVKLDAKTGGFLQDDKERAKEPALDGRADGKEFIKDARSSGSTFVPNSVGAVQNKGTVKHSEKKIDPKVDGKEKVREKDGDGRKRDKRKEKDRNKPVHKDMEKEKKKEEIMKTTEEKQMQVTRMKNGSESHMLKPNSKDGNQKDPSGVQNVGSHNTTNDSNHHAATVNNNLRKRKDIGLNGIYDEHVTGPNKMAKSTASPHPFSENGRSLEPCQNSAASSAPSIPQPSMDIKAECNLSYDDTQKPPMKIKVDGKDFKNNGTIAIPRAQSSHEHTAKAERKSEVPAKPPHPDIKYLDQVLSVPKMDEWSDFEDQEWLFSCNSSSTRKPEVKSSGNDETPQVWARALWLEPVDVYALPYVIPH